MKKSTHDVVAKADEMFEVAKKIKAWRNRYMTKYEKIEEAKTEVITLKEELLDIAESMLRDKDDIERRDPGQVHRDIARSEARLAKAIERNAQDVEEMDALCDELAGYVMLETTPLEEVVPEEVEMESEVEAFQSGAEQESPIQESGNVDVPSSLSENTFPLVDDCVQYHAPEATLDDENDFNFSSGERM